jgi:aryl-alcohol dehydrogenase-like predicted oxidoreductase
MTDARVNRRRFVGTGAAAAAVALHVGPAVPGKAAETGAAAEAARKTRSYNEKMEYRRLGRTELWLSAVSIGGHWKKIQHSHGTDGFKKNRREVLAACMDHGINYIDACWNQEVVAYGEAVKGRRDEIFFGFSCGANESRFTQWAGSLQKMKDGYDAGLKAAGLEHADLWRITMHEATSRRNSEKEIEIAMQALDWAKKAGKARFTGVSSHDRPWIAEAVKKYPQLEVIVTPYTADTKEKPTGACSSRCGKRTSG